MASSASSDAADLRRRGRQRLIGAVAIVLLLVVFVPMLLDSEPRRTREEPAVEIPDKDKAAPLPMPAPKPTPREAVAKGLANADSATPADAGTAAPQTAQPAAVASVATVPAKGDGGTPGAAAGPRLEGFAVQVGAFRDEAKLRQARDKLTAAGIPHYTERLDTSSGALTRLRAGPFPTRQGADAAASKLKQGGLASQVVPLP